MARISAVGAWLLLILAAAQGIAQEPAAQLTLEQALQVAFERSPVLRAQRAEVAEAEGRLVAARTMVFNPALSVDAASRRGPGARSTDRGIEVSQEIERSRSPGPPSTASPPKGRRRAWPSSRRSPRHTPATRRAAPRRRGSASR